VLSKPVVGAWPIFGVLPKAWRGSWEHPEKPPNISHCQNEELIHFERAPSRNSRTPLQKPPVISPKLIEKLPFYG